MQKNLENDYRPVLENFAHDLLTTVDLPEWPASALLLEVLSASLAAALKGGDHSAVLRLTALDVTGAVVAAFRCHRGVSAARLALPPLVDMTDTTEGVEDDRCLCGSGYGSRFMLDCDRCHRWFHGSCVGIDPAAPPATWLCDACHLHSLLQHLPVALSVTLTDDATSLPREGLQQLLLRYLGSRVGVDSAGKYAREFWLVQWLELCPEEMRGYYQQLWETLDKPQPANNSILTRDGNIQLVRELASDSVLSQRVQSLLQHLLAVLGEPQAQIRSKAMKSLITIVSEDPAILSDVISVCFLC